MSLVAGNRPRRRSSRLLRWGRGVAVGLAVLAALVVVGTLVPRPFLPTVSAGESRPLNLVLLSTEIHTDIAIPLDPQTRESFAFLAADGVPVDDPAYEWLIIGWGGRDFYLKTPSWSELQLKPLLKGLTIDRSVLRFDVAQSIPANQPNFLPFAITEGGLTDLVSYVQDSFALANGSRVVIPGAGYGPTDRFYEARGYFNALVGCNTWTASALRRAGLRTGLWNPLPQSLGLSLSLYN